MLKRITATFIAVAMVINTAMPTVYALENTGDISDEIVHEQHITEETSAEEIIVETEEESEDLICQESSDETEAVLSEFEEFVVDFSASETDWPDNDEIFASYVEQQFYDNSVAVFGVSARERLNNVEKAIYDFLKANIENAARNGGSTEFILRTPSEIGIKDTWTAEELGVEHIVSTSDVEKKFLAQFDIGKIHEALLYDCPYELYWYDKTEGMISGYRGSVAGYYGPDGIPRYTKISFLDFKFAFPVAYNYAEGNICNITSDVSRVETAVNNAKNIADKYKNETKYNKLVAFKDEICNLVTYNYFAAQEGNFTYNNDPWQLIYVFDGDKGTDVVCEGYAKAFQYLCDLSEIECYTVSGEMIGATGAGGHMWNIVVLDGKNYLADITNTDAGTIGQNGQLFLAGTQGSVTDGYIFKIGSQYVTYDYFDDMVTVWGEDLLTISSVNYNADVVNTEYGVSKDGGRCGAALSWNVYDSDNNGSGDILVINGNGEMYDYVTVSSPWNSYNSSIKKVIIEDGVVSVGGRTFSGCVNLETVEIPGTVEIIKTDAFADCGMLKQVVFTGTIQQWNEVVIHPGNEDIDSAEMIFNGCGKAHSWVEATCTTPKHCIACNITEGETLPHIQEKIEAKAPTCTEEGLTEGSKCFVCHTIIEAQKVVDALGHNVEVFIPNSDGTKTGKCIRCNEIITENTMTEIESGLCGDSVYWKLWDSDFDGTGDTLTVSGNGDMSNDSPWSEYVADIKVAVIEDGVTSIGDSAFFGCTSLLKVTIPESVTSIGSRAFSGCTTLETAVIPENVTSIGAGAFSNCQSLVSINIPVSVTVIGENAFGGCISLENVTYAGTIDQWNNIQTDDNFGGLGDKEIVTRSSYETAENADGTLTITGVNITLRGEFTVPSEIEGKTVTAIGENAFANCTEITALVIPQTITAIGTGAFSGCASLKNVTIPDSVTVIGENVFDVNAETVFAVNKNSAAYSWLTDKGFTNLDVKVTLDRIEVPDQIEIEVLDEKQLNVTIHPEDATETPEFVWSVEDSSVAEYDAATGIITAKNIGTTIITVTDTISGKSASSTINVVLPDDVKLKITTDESTEDNVLQTGDKRNIVVTCETTKGVYTIPNSCLVFKAMEGKKVSENITIDEHGEITSLYKGEGTKSVEITATLKSDKTKSVKLKVKAIARQVQELPLDRPVVKYTGEDGSECEAQVEQTGYGYIVVLPRDAVKAESVTFEICGKLDKAPFEAAGAKIPAIKWTTSDSKAAKLTTAKPEDASEYRTTVTIKKGSTGVYTVKAVANDINKASISVDIDVRDYTPRLEKNKVTLNTYKEEGVSVKLYTAYDSYLENYNEEIAMLMTEGEEEINVKLEGNENFYAVYDKENKSVTINAKDIAGNTKKDKEHKLTLVIDTSEGVTRQTVKVAVSNKLPAVTVKQNGTFNSFYKSSEVFTAVTAKDAAVTDVKLVESSTPTFVTEFVPQGESQTSGVRVSWSDKNDPTTGYVKEKADTSATLEVYLEGYRQPVSAKYAVSIKESAPKLSQSRSSSRYTYLNRENEPVRVTNNTTGEPVVFADNWKVTSTSANHVTVEAAGEELSIRVNETNKFTKNKPDHTVKVAVQESDWIKPVTVSHKVTVNLSKPAISPKESEVTLRSWYQDSVEMTFKAGESNCPVPEFTFESSSAKESVITEAEKIEFVQDGWKVTATIKEGTEIADGTYSYNVTPVITLADNSTETLKSVKVKVKVGTAEPALSFDTKSVTLSGTGTDSAEITAKADDVECPVPVRYVFTPDTKDKKVKAEAEKIEFTTEGWNITAGLDVNNLPKNASYKYKVTGYVQAADGSETALKTASITVKVSTPALKASLSKTSISLNRDILEGYEIEPKVTEGYRITDVEIVPNTKAGEKLAVSYDNGVITAKITDSTISTNKDKAYTYPIKITAAIDKEGVTTCKVLETKLSVKVISGARKLSTKASGSIDLAVREKGITYTITGGSGFNYNAEMLEGKTVTLAGTYKDGLVTKPISELFEAGEVEYNAKGQATVTVKAKSGAAIKYDTTYKYQLVTEIEEIGEVVSSTMSVKTKQSTLKFKVSGDTTVYHKHESGRLTVTVTSPNGAKIKDIKVLDTKATTVPAGAILFSEAADNGDGSWTIDYEVIRVSGLKTGKTYKLALVVTPEGIASNKSPQTLSVSLKVER